MRIQHVAVSLDPAQAAAGHRAGVVSHAAPRKASEIEACHFPEVAEICAGRVVPLGSDAVADALREVLSDSKLGPQMGEAGRALVMSRFTWPAIAEQALDMYKRAMGASA